MRAAWQHISEPAREIILAFRAAQDKIDPEHRRDRLVLVEHWEGQRRIYP